MISEKGQDWRSRNTIKVEEAAPILGISRSSAYDAAHTGEIPTLRIGRRLLVPVLSLRRMLGEVDPETSNVTVRRGLAGAVTSSPQRKELRR